MHLSTEATEESLGRVITLVVTIASFVRKSVQKSKRTAITFGWMLVIQEVEGQDLSCL